MIGRGGRGIRGEIRATIPSRKRNAASREGRHPERSEGSDLERRAPLIEARSFGVPQDDGRGTDPGVARRRSFFLGRGFHSLARLGPGVDVFGAGARGGHPIGGIKGDIVWK